MGCQQRLVLLVPIARSVSDSGGVCVGARVRSSLYAISRLCVRARVRVRIYIYIYIYIYACAHCMNSTLRDLL